MNQSREQRQTTQEGFFERFWQGLRKKPARFMQPRLILIVTVIALVAYGLVMIYSSSSITALASAKYDNNPAYFVIKQLQFGALGTAMCILFAIVDYRMYERLVVPLSFLMLVLLILPLLPGVGSNRLGASRWIQIAGFTLQPSEFAKASIIVFAAQYISKHDLHIRSREFLIQVGIGVLLPLVLIFFQPDKGSTIIILMGIFSMILVARYYHRFFAAAGIGLLAVIGAVAFSDEYSRSRILNTAHSAQDPYGQSYQLFQSMYAIANGGFFGVGLGNSTQKYAYLPMAYNDFIFAIIGEELGVAGILLLLALFGILLWAALEIALHADDEMGRLIVVGVITMIMAQAFINMLGVSGGIPLTGKPIPFISYGGSSIMGSLTLIGLILSVSIHSKLPETQADRRRQDWSVTQAPSYREDTGVGQVRARSARPAFEPIESLPRTSKQSRRQERIRAREVRDASGRRRIDLGPSATERLRGKDQRS